MTTRNFGYLVVRPALPAKLPFEAGQLVATYKLLDQLLVPFGTSAVSGGGGKDESRDDLQTGPAMAIEQYNVPSAWADDPHVVNAAEILTRAKGSEAMFRERTDRRIACECLEGKGPLKSLVRVFVGPDGDGKIRTWVLSNATKVGSKKTRIEKIPPRAVCIPMIAPLLATCPHCMRGVVVTPGPAESGAVFVSRLDTPTFGITVD